MKQTSLQSFWYEMAWRIMVICVLGCITGYLFFSPYWLSGIWTLAAMIIVFFNTMKRVNHSERKLHAFLQAINQNDFSIAFPEDKQPVSRELNQAFNEISQVYRKLRSDRESQYQLLNLIITHGAVPLICFNAHDGKIFLMNEAANKLFRIPYLDGIHSLQRIKPELPALLYSIQQGEPATMKMKQGSKSITVSVRVRQLQFKEKSLKLAVFHDVSNELALKEAETWQKLLHVLTHEISNSAIPLSTLSSHIYSHVEAVLVEGRKLSDDQRNDLLESLKTIENRSHFLKEFVRNFRSLSRLPEPDIQPVQVQELTGQLERLFRHAFESQGIQFTIHHAHSSELILADSNLTMQVLINLVRNAIESMQETDGDRRINIMTEQTDDQYLLLHIQDSGCGIAPDDLDQILIPFYTTKKGGSGIGLSISQQIMQRQKGNITVQSEVGRGSVFTLAFQCPDDVNHHVLN